MVSTKGWRLPSIPKDRATVIVSILALTAITTVVVLHEILAASLFSVETAKSILYWVGGIMVTVAVVAMMWNAHNIMKHSPPRDNISRQEWEDWYERNKEAIHASASDIEPPPWTSKKDDDHPSEGWKEGWREGWKEGFAAGRGNDEQ